MTIVITLPTFFPEEAERIVQLLQRGDVDLIHIRKPSLSLLCRKEVTIML